MHARKASRTRPNTLGKMLTSLKIMLVISRGTCLLGQSAAKAVALPQRLIGVAFVSALRQLLHYNLPGTRVGDLMG